MLPEDIPEDRKESYECYVCGGDITLQENRWECDTCDWSCEGWIKAFLNESNNNLTVKEFRDKYIKKGDI